MSEKIPRREVVLFPVAAGVAAQAPHFSAFAEQYPSKPIRMVVPFPAGGPTDIVARPLAKLLGDALQQQVYIDYRGGAGGAIGASNVAASPPDGHTILMGTVGTSAINPALYRKLTYDAVNDFTPIATVASGPVAIVAAPSTRFTSLGDTIAAANARPGSSRTAPPAAERLGISRGPCSVRPRASRCNTSPTEAVR